MHKQVGRRSFFCDRIVKDVANKRGVVKDAGW
jgi:hypothetical protein